MTDDPPRVQIPLDAETALRALLRVPASNADTHTAEDEASSAEYNEGPDE